MSPHRAAPGYRDSAADGAAARARARPASGAAVIGLAEAGRDGGAQADVPGGGPQHGDEGGRFEPAQEGRMIAGVHDEAVGDEEQVELPALGLAGDLLDEREVVVAGRRALLSPPRGVVAGAENEHPEVHLAPRRTHGDHSCPGFSTVPGSRATTLPRAHSPLRQRWRVASWTNSSRSPSGPRVWKASPRAGGSAGLKVPRSLT
jgi:hypothetical protein